MRECRYISACMMSLLLFCCQSKSTYDEVLNTCVFEEITNNPLLYPIENEAYIDMFISGRISSECKVDIDSMIAEWTTTDKYGNEFISSYRKKYIYRWFYNECGLKQRDIYLQAASFSEWSREILENIYSVDFKRSQYADRPLPRTSDFSQIRMQHLPNENHVTLNDDCLYVMTISGVVKFKELYAVEIASGCKGYGLNRKLYIISGHEQLNIIDIHQDDNKY